MRRLLAVSFATAVPIGAAAAQATFGEVHRMVPSGNSMAKAALLCDLGGDGRLDLLVAADSGVVRSRGRAGGWFEQDAAPLPQVFSVTGLVAADVDGDGDPDLLVTSWTGDRLWRNDGAGGLTDATAWLPAAAAAGSAGVAVGDVDGDLDVDLWFATNGQDRLFLNDGNGVFSDATASLPAEGDATRQAIFGDFDGDLDLDVFLANDAAQNRVFRNDGLGHFTNTTAADLPVDVGAVLSLAAGDVDADGDLDLLIGNWGLQDRLYRNDGNGHFVDDTASSMPSDAAVARGVALLDLDGDGDLDAVFASDQLDRLYHNDGLGHFTDGSASLPQRGEHSFALATGDVDGDGDIDLFFGGAGQRDALLLNDGQSAFVDAAADGLPADLRPLLFADVDGDGDADQFAAVGADLWLLVQDDDGAFGGARLAATWTLPNGPTSVAVGDLDADGDVDAVVGVQQGSLVVLRNDGPPGFAAVALPGTAPTTAVALGDLDGDGDLDLVAGLDRGWTQLWFNDGTGALALGSFPLDTTSDLVHQVLLVDLDGDQDLDAFLCAAGNGFTGGSSWWRNDGAGNFVQVRTFVSAGQGDVGDLDGDGDPDLLLGTAGGLAFPGGWTYGNDYLWFNDGAGTFAQVVLPQDGADTYGAQLGDVDLDGDLDIVLSTGGSYGAGDLHRLLRNDGTGAFTADPAAMPQTLRRASRLILCDVDCDGDPDAVVREEPRLVANLTQHVTWRALPRIGQPLDFDVRAPAGSTFILAYSTIALRLPVPGIGVLGIGLADIVTIGIGPVDGAGQATAGLFVPPDPGLIGGRVYVQMLTGPALALSNRETVTVTPF